MQGTDRERHRFAADDLQRFAVAVFTAAGMTGADAVILGRSLVDADERGVHTHGLARVPAYVGQLRSGEVTAVPKVRVVSRRGCATLLDGDGGFGAPAGVRAVEEAVRAARDLSVGIVGVRNVAHFGAAGYYARLAAGQGCVGVAMTSTSVVVAPAGAAGPRVGNNPIAIAVPHREGQVEFCLDMAMSVVARGRVKLAALRGERLPEGWAVDAAGLPTRDPEAALAGALLPVGDYKGSGLAIAVEILAAALTGARLSQDVRHSGFTASGTRPGPGSPGGGPGRSGERPGPPGGGSGPPERPPGDVTVGNLFIAIDLGVFRDPEDVLDDVERILGFIASSTPRPGAAVRIPGEPEAALQAESLRRGVPLEDGTVSELAALGAAYGVAFPEPVRGPSRDLHTS